MGQLKLLTYQKKTMHINSVDIVLNSVDVALYSVYLKWTSDYEVFNKVWGCSVGFRAFFFEHLDRIQLYSNSKCKNVLLSKHIWTALYSLYHARIVTSFGKIINKKQNDKSYAQEFIVCNMLFIHTSVHLSINFLHQTHFWSLSHKATGIHRANKQLNIYISQPNTW